MKPRVRLTDEAKAAIEAPQPAPPQPIPNGEFGRNSLGQFAKGNKGGPGNPFAHRVAQYRALLMATIEPGDLVDVIRTLMAQAKGGDVAASKVRFDRVLGRVSSTVIEDILRETLRQSVYDPDKKFL
jgi:hypothetical protein